MHNLYTCNARFSLQINYHTQTITSYMPRHFVIIGAGLAGTMLAARLLAEKQRVTLIDDEQSETASRLAAGMFNVITGKFAKKTWLATDLLQALNDFFALPEFAELARFFHPIPIYRPFSDIGEYNRWLGQMAETDFQELIRFQEQGMMEDCIHNPLGGIFIDQCGWLDMVNFIAALKNILIKEQSLSYISANISPEHIDLLTKKIYVEGKDKKYLSDGNILDGMTIEKGEIPPSPELFPSTSLREQYSNSLTRQAIDFDELVFCQGHAISQHPLWEIPLTPNKGQVLKIYAPDLHIPFIISEKIYILPIGDGYFTVGATYEWSYDSPTPTSTGLAELTASLDEILKVKYEIITHRAAIRPATHDRRPVLGTHPKQPHLHVFTGFGTKGVLLSPYFSQVMADYLMGKITQIPKECDVLRYYRKGKMKV